MVKLETTPLAIPGAPLVAPLGGNSSRLLWLAGYADVVPFTPPAVDLVMEGEPETAIYPPPPPPPGPSASSLV